MPLLRVEEVNLHSSPLGHKTRNKTDEKYEAWVIRGEGREISEIIQVLSSLVGRRMEQSRETVFSESE